MLSHLLDTHILVWWRTAPERLSAAQNRALLELEKRGQPAGISAITLWELAMMVARGRQEINVPLDYWLEEIENHPMLEVLPISATVAAESVRLTDGFHKDPADQIIVATARCHSLHLLTADERIRSWGKVALV
jgi:PIN domain nuclease of toxin-antitoxin system